MTKTDHLLHECLPCFKVPLRNPRKIFDAVGCTKLSR